MERSCGRFRIWNSVISRAEAEQKKWKKNDDVTNYNGLYKPPVKWHEDKNREKVREINVIKMERSQSVR